MVLMSGTTTEKSESLHPDNNADSSLSSDSGVSSCGKDDSSSSSGTSGNPRGKSKSPQDQEKHQNQKREGEDLRDEGGRFFKKNFRKNSGERGGDYSDFFGDDPFFADRGSKLFGDKSRFADRPRLSERIFGKKGHSVFDNDKFVDDLRKRIQEEKKMFFDGGSDPFASAFSGRPTSPVGGGSGRTFEDLRNGARARFDEFANRHPSMFSTMRNQPAWDFDDPFGPHHHHGFPRERHNSGSSGMGSGASTASSGEERVIPIQIIRDDPPKAPQPQQSPPQAPPRGKSPGPPNIIIREKSPQPPTTATPGPQRCNTEPNNPSLVEENRAARAQSAPPVSQNGFAPKMNGDASEGKPEATQVGGNCSKSPKPEQAPPSNSGNGNGGVRSIPIIVEGRKAPVVNSMPNGNCQSQTPPQQSKMSRPAERSPTPPPKKPAPPKDPLAQVNAVLDEVKELAKQVEEFKGTSREDRDFIVLDEMLTRCLIKLDVVEAEGRDDVRTARKDCIKFIQSCISKLETKTQSPAKTDDVNGNDEQQPMEVGSQLSSQTPTGETEKMEIGSQPIPLPSCDGDQSSQPETNKADQKMDTDSQSSGNTSAKEEGKDKEAQASEIDEQPQLPVKDLKKIFE